MSGRTIKRLKFMASFCTSLVHPQYIKEKGLIVVLFPFTNTSSKSQLLWTSHERQTPEEVCCPTPQWAVLLPACYIATQQTKLRNATAQIYLENFSPHSNQKGQLRKRKPNGIPNLTADWHPCWFISKQYIAILTSFE